jgi:hypothetical protein
MGLFAGSIAVKVAAGNIKFAYAVQGASVGAVLSRASTPIWKPMILETVPEICPIQASTAGYYDDMSVAALADSKCYMDWIELGVGVSFATWAAVISNKYRGLISVVATCAIGTFGSVQIAAGFGIPGMEKFTFGSLMSGGVTCDDDDDSCWGSLYTVLGMLGGGMSNQFKLASMDFNLPPASSYERFLHRIEDKLRILFAINEFIEGGVDLDTDDLMERCLQARDSLVKYTNIAANLMHFSLCFGFVGDFIQQMNLGVYNAVPWVGVFSLCLVIVTPIQGAVGMISDILTSKRFRARVKEVVLPSWLKWCCSSRIPVVGLGDSFIVKFGPIGRWFQQLSFYLGMVNIFINVGVVGICYLISDMYEVEMAVQWPIDGFPADMGFDEAFARVSGPI